MSIPNDFLTSLPRKPTLLLDYMNKDRTNLLNGLSYTPVGFRIPNYF